MQHPAFFLTLLVCATLMALVEIQTEGADGWAAKFPTWRIENRWTDLFFSRKPLTGYHLFLLLFVAACVHAPFGTGLLPWTWAAERRVLAFMVFFWIAEDFLWFVLNPAFGLPRFRAEHIWWHRPTWWWIAPRDYWVFGIVGTVLYLL